VNFLSQLPDAEYKNSELKQDTNNNYWFIVQLYREFEQGSPATKLGIISSLFTIFGISLLAVFSNYILHFIFGVNLEKLGFQMIRLSIVFLFVLLYLYIIVIIVVAYKNGTNRHILERIFYYFMFVIFLLFLTGFLIPFLNFIFSIDIA